MTKKGIAKKLFLSFHKYLFPNYLEINLFLSQHTLPLAIASGKKLHYHNIFKTWCLLLALLDFRPYTDISTFEILPRHCALALWWAWGTALRLKSTKDG